ncbi:hypothetical protein LAJ19_20330 (plasmid) [Deinococcus taeanensis]|uniref:hypothetical protein n=1 Tax=Deinococcus taeanensis TaxID=2737050 RepID=UPI001CDC54DD|nr:hypothetical protein [Deinococcus taeanensis]UBV45475.1 hypothetical protein LAJ19_20330 [Deinococcus taeanensis]
MKRILLPFLIALSGVASAVPAPFDTLFPGARVITRAANYGANQAYGGYQYRLPAGTFDLGYELRLTAHEVARVRSVTVYVQPPGADTPTLNAASGQVVEQLFAQVAQRCFGMRSERVPALRAWVHSTVSAGGMAKGSAVFGPVQLKFERTQSSGAGYYDLNYTLTREGVPGTAPWASYCTFF